jgi:hypothetical protein
MKLIKNIIYLSVASLFLLQACVKDEADIFNDTASARGQKAVAEHRALLVSAENGWYVDYYPELDHKVGGYAMYLKFKNDGMVDVSCEIETNLPPRQVETSQFEVFMEQGPILSFATYNRVMHYFSEPSSSDINGLEGDYEFIIMKAETDEIQIKGKKGGNKMILRRNTDNINPDIHLAEIADMAELMSEFALFELFVNNASAGSAVVDERTFDLDYSGNRADEKISYAFTNDGIRLYEPLTVNGVTVQNFVWDDVNEQYVSTDQGANVYFKSYFPSDYQIRYEEFLGKWELNYEARNTAWLTPAMDTVEFIELKRNDTYIMKCDKLFNFDGLQLSFDPRRGIVSIYVNNVGLSGNNFIRQCIYDTQEGYYNYGLNGIIGLIGVWNNDENGKRKITFVDNGVWGAHIADGVSLRLFDASSVNIGNYTGNINGRYLFRNLVLTKID